MGFDLLECLFSFEYGCFAGVGEPWFWGCVWFGVGFWDGFIADGYEGGGEFLDGVG